MKKHFDNATWKAMHSDHAAELLAGALEEDMLLDKLPAPVSQFMAQGGIDPQKGIRAIIAARIEQIRQRRQSIMRNYE
ncbi:hypothetical protein [Paenibacillus sp. GXUN7292]|uniref:hypothetical protein n=1 Tax=Paenibacillus sp. GXUN7292 TaxID=3422499 RepID=UPI003D7CDE85